jgi:hypothetical protein
VTAEPMVRTLKDEVKGVNARAALEETSAVSHVDESIVPRLKIASNDFGLVRVFKREQDKRRSILASAERVRARQARRVQGSRSHHQ